MYDLRFTKHHWALYFLLLILLVVPLAVQSQISPSKYFIRFKDRNNSPFTLNTPADFLSAKAIARRSAHAIAYEENDLPVNPQYIDSIISKGATILTRSKWLNGVTISIPDSTALSGVQNLPFVLSSAAVQQRKANTKTFLKNDLPLNNATPYLRTTETYNYGLSYNQTGLLHLDSLHVQGYTGTGLTIAVLDDGFYNVDSIAAFDSLRTNNQIISTRDFVENDTEVYSDTIFGSGNIIHGMYTLSVMAGNIPGQLVGTAPKANYILIRTEQAASEYLIEEYNWIAGAEYADSSGADILSTSLIYTTFEDANQNHKYSDMNGNTCPMTIAADIAASKGLLVVNSAGNDAAKPWHYIGTAADGDSVMAVGAVDGLGNYAAFSSTGPSFDGRVKPNVAAMGNPATTADVSGGVTFQNGTSFSGPIIAGASACLWQKYPNASNMDIFHAIEQSASQYASPDSLIGYGIPDFYKANIILAGISDRNPKKLCIYPVPAHETITITLPEPATKAELRIIDLLGNTVLVRNISANETIFQVDVNILAKGVYIVQIITSQQTLESKLIKQ